MECCVDGRTVVHLECIGSIEELEALRPEWSGLWNRCPSATPFQSPEWVITWWKYLGNGQLWFLTIRKDQALRGLAPFFLQVDPITSRRQLLLIGTGISDYLDLLIEPGFEPVVTEAIRSHLEQSCGSWDACDFQQLPESSPLVSMPDGHGWKSQLTVQEVCPVLTLPESKEQLSSHIPSHMLAKLRYYRKRAQRMATTRTEAVEPGNFCELFDCFLRLHQARWGIRGQKGVLADATLVQFHREIAEAMLLSGRLRMYALRIGGEVVACLYGFSHAERYFYYLGGFQPLVAPLSPGTILIGHAIEEAIGEGAGEFDFLRGREAYKYLWGARGRMNYRKQFRHPGDQAPRPEVQGTTQ